MPGDSQAALGDKHASCPTYVLLSIHWPLAMINWYFWTFSNPAFASNMSLTRNFTPRTCSQSKEINSLSNCWKINNWATWPQYSWPLDSECMLNECGTQLKKKKGTSSALDSFLPLHSQEGDRRDLLHMPPPNYMINKISSRSSLFDWCLSQ